MIAQKSFVQILQDIDKRVNFARRGSRYTSARGYPALRHTLNSVLAAFSLTSVDAVVFRTYTRRTALPTILPHSTAPSARGAGETTVITATAAIESGHRGRRPAAD